MKLVNLYSMQNICRGNIKSLAKDLLPVVHSSHAVLRNMSSCDTEVKRSSPSLSRNWTILLLATSFIVNVALTGFMFALLRRQHTDEIATLETKLKQGNTTEEIFLRSAAIDHEINKRMVDEDEYSQSVSDVGSVVVSAIKRICNPEGGVCPAGPKGEPGEDGLPGRDGQPGSKGQAGEQGPRGMATKGEMGMKGEMGSKGQKGEKGESGQQGGGSTPGEYFCTVAGVTYTYLVVHVELICTGLYSNSRVMSPNQGTWA